MWRIEFKYGLKLRDYNSKHARGRLAQGSFPVASGTNHANMLS